MSTSRSSGIPSYHTPIISIFSHDVGQEWLTGFVQETNLPKCIFDYNDMMKVLSYDQGIWEYSYKDEPICEPFVGLTQATELALYLKETYVIPYLSLFQEGHQKEDLHRISFTINNHLKEDQSFFVSQFVRYNLAYISQSLAKRVNTMSQFAGMDFVGTTPSKILTNFYFPETVAPENVIFEIRQLFFKIGLKFKYDMPDDLYAFRPGMFTVGEKEKMIARPVQYGSFVAAYVNSLPNVNANALKRPIILDFQFTEPAKPSSCGLFVAKVTFKLNQNEPRLQFFAMIYEILGNINMEQMQKLDLKEIRIVPLKIDEFTLYVSITRTAEDASLQIALIQEVITLILRSVGISNEVFIGTMVDMTKRFNLIKGVSTLSKEIRGDSAIEFKVETKADREAVRKEAEKKKLELVKKEEEDKKKKAAVPQPAQKSMRQLMKEATQRDKKASRAAKNIAKLVPEIKEVKEIKEIKEVKEDDAVKAKEEKDDRGKEEKDDKGNEEEVLFSPKPVPVKVKKTKVKASKKRRQEMLQSGQLNRNKPATTSTTSTAETNQSQEPSLQAQIEAASAEMSPQLARKNIDAIALKLSAERELTPLERALGQKEPKIESSTSNSEHVVIGSESILQWFHPKEPKTSIDTCSGPIFGPVLAKCSPILGPAIVAEAIQVEPVVEPTPEKEVEIAETSNSAVASTSSKPTLVPVKMPCLSASAAEFVPSSVLANGTTVTATISPEFYPSPRVLVTSAGEPLSQGHHVGFWTSYAGFNLWSNPAWTRFQAVHIVWRVLGVKAPTERYASLSFDVTDEDAGLCLNQVVNWITLSADYYVKTRTVAVSLIGAAHSIGGSSTAIVFTLRFPDDDDFSAYKYKKLSYKFDLHRLL